MARFCINTFHKLVQSNPFLPGLNHFPQLFHPKINLFMARKGCVRNNWDVMNAGIFGMQNPGKMTDAKIHKGLLKSEELYQYILETSVYPNEPESLKELRAVTANQPESIMATSPDVGQLISMLLKLTNAKNTIEVGVFTGYSLLCSALAIPDDGKVTAIDPNQEAYEVGLPIIRKSGVEHKIDFIKSEALPVLDKLLQDPSNEGSFDFAFVDGDKPNYQNYHERMIKLVKVGGLIVYDNTLWAGTVVMPDESIYPEKLRPGKHHAIKFNKVLASDSRLELVHASMGDGVAICRRVC